MGEMIFSLREWFKKWLKKKKKSVFALGIQPLDLCVEFNAEGGTSDVSTSIVTFFCVNGSFRMKCHPTSYTSAQNLST